jgi:hypothetical protein
MKKNYLPSKQFIFQVVAILILLATVFGIYEITLYFKNRNSSKQGTQTTLLVKDVVQKDSNDNGIPDWEESLWGFDPTKNGPENKEAILAKRAELAKDNPLPLDENGQEKALTENETLSREFFALIMSLQQSGNLNETSMNSVASTISEKINPTPIPDIYTKADQITKNTNKKEDMVSYAKNIQKLLQEHKDLGNELTYISQGVENQDPTALSLVENAASSYKSLGKELVKIPVPSSLAPTMLNMANNYEKIGQSTEGLTKSIDNPILAMASLINYKKYNDALLVDIDNFSKGI